jgi:hypothetical protein
MNPNPERSHPIAIFTAVLFHPQLRINRTEQQQNSNCAGTDDCQDTATCTFSSDDDCDRQDDTLDSDYDPVIRAAAQRLTRFQRYTMVLGLIVGFFTEFSSLAATFLLTTAVSSTTTDTSNIVWFSLGRYFFSSALGVTIFLFLRCIVTTAWNMTSSISGRGNVVDDSTMIHKMESNFTVGASVGVCLAWTCTNLFLGLTGQSSNLVLGLTVQSCVTLAVPPMWYRVTTYTGSLRSMLTLNPTTTTDVGLAAPLLSATTEPQPETDSMSPTTIMSYRRIFQRYSLALGTVVGFVIHFSQLEAKLLLSVLYGTALEQQQHITAIMFFSFGWSFLTACMGVLILILLHNLVLLVWSNLDQEQDQEQHEDQQCFTRGVNTNLPALLNYLLLCMASCFVTGALLGVNMGWVVTDTLLGLRFHLMQSILALGVAVVCWCTSVAAEAQVSKKVTEQDASSLLIV